LIKDKPEPELIRPLTPAISSRANTDKILDNILAPIRDNLNTSPLSRPESEMKKSSKTVTISVSSPEILNENLTSTKKKHNKKKEKMFEQNQNEQH
jgi:hypothetical protein